MAIRGEAGEGRRGKAARLIGRVDLSPTLAIWRFELEGGTPDFEPGQFLNLGLPREAGSDRLVWRAYSIASPPEERRWVEFYVRWAVDPVAGMFTTRLGRLAPGDELRWRGPAGRFTLEHRRPDGTPDERRLVFVAGGAGLAPFVSMALHLHASGSRREVVLCHGASHVAELGYRARLEELEAQSAADERRRWRFRYLPTISRPLDARNVGWRGEVGRVHALLEARPGGAPSALERAIGERLTPEACFVYVCGFRGTVEDARRVLAPLGFRGERARRADGSFDMKSESYG